MSISLCTQAKRSFLHSLFLENETQIGEKKYRMMFFNGIAVHMQKFGQIRPKSKNGLKFDIGRLCSQPFNYAEKHWPGITDPQVFRTESHQMDKTQHLCIFTTMALQE